MNHRSFYKYRFFCFIKFVANLDNVEKKISHLNLDSNLRRYENVENKDGGTSKLNLVNTPPSI